MDRQKVAINSNDRKALGSSFFFRKIAARRKNQKQSRNSRKIKR